MVDYTFSYPIILTMYVNHLILRADKNKFLLFRGHTRIFVYYSIQVLKSKSNLNLEYNSIVPTCNIVKYMHDVPYIFVMKWVLKVNNKYIISCSNRNLQVTL